MLMDMFLILWRFWGDLQGTTGLLRPRLGFPQSHSSPTWDPYAMMPERANKIGLRIPLWAFPGLASTSSRDTAGPRLLG